MLMETICGTPVFLFWFFLCTKSFGGSAEWSELLAHIRNTCICQTLENYFHQHFSSRVFAKLPHQKIHMNADTIHYTEVLNFTGSGVGFGVKKNTGQRSNERAYLFSKPQSQLSKFSHFGNAISHLKWTFAVPHVN